MSRSIVTCIATVKALKFEGDDGNFEFKPWGMYAPGTMGSYCWTPVGPDRWKAVRLTSSESSAMSEAISLSCCLGGGKVNGQDPRERALAEALASGYDHDEATAVNGRQYLLATSAGSARAGLLGRYISPEKETDPVLRVLREHQIGVRRLERVATGHELSSSCRWYDNGHCPNGRQVNWWVTDGVQRKLDPVQLEAPSGYFDGGGTYTSVIAEFTYAVHVTAYRWMNGTTRRQILSVVVTPGCEPERLAAAIGEVAL